MARYKKHVISYGDTPQSIAHIETGNVANWQDIVKYNGLAYPYIVDTVEEKMVNPDKLVTYGDTIIVPVEASLNEINVDTLNRQDADLVYSLVLGRDLASQLTSEATPMGDEILSLEANNNGDLQTVEGLENLKQSLIKRLLTPRGALLLHPTYGSALHKMFKKATIEQGVLIKNEIMSTLKKDGRVEGVVANSSTIEEDRYVGSFTVYIYSLQAAFDLLVAADTSGSITLL